MKQLGKKPYVERDKRNRWYFFMLFIFCAMHGYPVPGQAVYQIMVPLTTSPAAGAELHVLLHHELSRLESYIFPSEVFRNEDSWSKAGNILYRLTRMGTVGFYMAYIPVVNQHEYFGHLARAKQFQSEYTKYEIYFFPPSGGRAYFGRSAYHTLTDTELLTEYMGGVEANSIMAATVQKNTLLNGRISYQDAMLYLGAVTDFSGYVLLEDNGSFDDVSQYLSVLNSQRDPENRIERNDLVFPAVLSMVLEPYFLQSLYALITQFLIRGYTTYDAPSMIPAGRLGFLPSYAFEPGAGGFRHYLGAYLRSEKHLYHVGMHKAALDGNSDFGVHAKLFGFSLKRQLLSFDLDLRYWHSEAFEYHYNANEVRETNLSGALAAVKLYLQALPGSKSGKRIFLTTGISMKSPGYTKGYPLPGGISFNFGLAFST